MNEKVFGSQKQGSIKDIPLPQENNAHTLNLGEESSPHRPPNNDWRRAKSQNRRWGVKLTAAGLLLLFVLVGYSSLFHRATVDLQQRSQQSVIANQEMTATVQGSEGVLNFIRVSPFERTESLYIEGSVEENRQTKSTGMITVYNTGSSEKNYIKDTRFETPDGNVYRAFSRFTIPAGTAENPGTTDILVVAENPGDKYNSESDLTFVLPALREQGDPAFDNVYAQQSEPITGGYSGVIRVPTQDDIDEAETKLTSRLGQTLRSEFIETLPDNYVIYDELITVSEPTFTQTPDEEKGGITLRGRAELYAVVFAQDSFEQYLASNFVDGYQDEPIDITNIDDFNITVNEDDFDPETVESFDFSLTGEAQFVWPIDTDQVRTTVAGKLRSHVENGLVLGLDNITVTDVSVSPFWRRSLPDNTDRITITID